MNLIFKELCVSYEDSNHIVAALSDVSFKVKKGEITALVGESGSGKTTLALSAMGLLPCNASKKGQIWIGTKMVRDLEENGMNLLRLDKIAMVFQNGASNFNPVLNILDQVAEPLIVKGEEKKEAKKRAEEMLLKMGLKKDLILRFPHQLSGGQVQRALFAMAMILNPDILILDEPTASLDNLTKNFVKNIIKEQAKKGKAVLLITHDIALASEIADKTVVLYMGQVLEETPHKITDKAFHPYTSALVRSFPFMDTTRELGGIRGKAFYRYTHHHSPGDENHNHIMSENNHDLVHTPASGCIFRPRCTQALSKCSSGIDMVENEDAKIKCIRGGISDLLVLDNVSRSYGKLKALKPLDLKIKSGELFCLVGETGSGKSTLGMIASNAVPPDTGSCEFNSFDTEGRSITETIGIVYQSPQESVSHRLNIFDIVAEPLVISGVNRILIKEKVLKALLRAQLSTDENFLKKFPHELNMGALQRVCIARAVVNEPLFLLADEPTSSLDPSVQAKVLKMLLDLQTEMGLTMLFITHNIGLSKKIADKVGVMLSGNMVEMGRAKNIFNSPLHPYTAMLLNEKDNFESDFCDGENLCPFLGRCQYAENICLKKMPGRKILGDGFLMCHRFNDEYLSYDEMYSEKVRTTFSIMQNPELKRF